MSDSTSTWELRTGLESAEAAGRDGAELSTNGDAATAALFTHAHRLGSLQRLLTFVRDSVIAQRADEGARHLMADIAIDLALARELVWRADPAEPFTVSLAGVAVRDALTGALASAATIVDDEHWSEFVTLRSSLEDGLRSDPAGDLETVSRSLLSGHAVLGGK